MRSESEYKGLSPPQCTIATKCIRTDVGNTLLSPKRVSVGLTVGSTDKGQATLLLHYSEANNLLGFKHNNKPFWKSLPDKTPASLAFEPVSLSATAIDLQPPFLPRNAMSGAEPLRVPWRSTYSLGGGVEIDGTLAMTAGGVVTKAQKIGPDSKVTRANTFYYNTSSGVAHESGGKFDILFGVSGQPWIPISFAIAAQQNFANQNARYVFKDDRHSLAP